MTNEYEPRRAKPVGVSDRVGALLERLWLVVALIGAALIGAGLVIFWRGL